MKYFLQVDNMNSKKKNESEPAEFIFENYISVNLKLFRVMGMTIRTKDNKRDAKSRILERIPNAIATLVNLFVTYCQIRWCYDLWHTDTHLITQITTGGISNFVCLFKGFRLVYSREELQTIFEDLSTIWRRTLIPRERLREICNKARGTRSFCIGYIVMMTSLFLTFTLPTLTNFLLQYLHREATNHTYDFNQRFYYMRYPFEITSVRIYSLVLAKEFYVTFNTGLHWIACDTLYMQLTTHLALLFKILEIDIATIGSNENSAISVEGELTRVIKKHKELLRFCESVQNIYSSILFTTMLFTSINICVNLFELQVMVDEGKITDAILHSLLLINIFIQLLIYCVYAERMTQQADSIVEAIYNCNWTGENYTVKRHLQIFLTKAQKSFRFTAFSFFKIDHSLITVIVNRALSFFTMLHTTS